MREILIKNDNENQRLDKYLMKYLNTAPKSFVYKMLRKKNIKLNDKKADGNEMLSAGDKVSLFLSDETIDKFQEAVTIKKPTSTNFDIIFEDNNILIVNKNVGILSHPEKESDTDTLIDKILFYLSEKGEFSVGKSSTFTPAICNRLDRNTSGIVVCGKSLAAVQELNKVFHDKGVDKFYITLVKGKVSEAGILKGYHSKNFEKNQVYIKSGKDEFSKEVITEYEPLKFTNDYSLLKIKLVTGKSHQIRAHLKTIHHPVVGDRKYGDEEVNNYFRKTFHIDKQLLHAEEIIFNEIDGSLFYLKGQKFVAPLPNIFKKIISSLFI